MRVVIDTNVLFEGLTKEGGDCGLLIKAWEAGIVRACVSNTLLFEYEDVLRRNLSQVQWNRIEPLLKALLPQSEFVKTYFTWRPSSSDPGDEDVIDCAMTAGVPVITFNTRGFRLARKALRLVVMTPAEAITDLQNQC